MCPLYLTHHSMWERWAAAVPQPGIIGWSHHPIPTLNTKRQAGKQLVTFLHLWLPSHGWNPPATSDRADTLALDH